MSPDDGPDDDPDDGSGLMILKIKKYINKVDSLSGFTKRVRKLSAMRRH